MNFQTVSHNLLATFSILFVIFTCQISAIFKSDNPFFSQEYAKVPLARVIVVDDVGDLLVSTLYRESKIYLLYETVNETDGTIELFQDILLNATELRLHHGLTYHQGYLYASSTSTVYRWAYQSGQRTRLNVTDGQVVISNIPPEGYHTTRTILFDLDNLLYVQVGAFADVDLDSARAKIRRFNLTDVPDGGIDFETGEVFADGVRNEVGLAFDHNGVLWGVENGANTPERPDLGDNIWLGNPAEDLNKFDKPLGTHYGYPYCFSSYLLENYTSNTQFVYSEFMSGEQIYSDDWCRDPANNEPPILAMPAHTAPLGIQFYDRTESCNIVEGSFPCMAIGHAFITFHHKEEVPNPVHGGYRVSWLPFNTTSMEPYGQYIDIIYEATGGPDNCGGPCYLPVSAVFDHKGHMFSSVDYSHTEDDGRIYRTTYGSPPPNIDKYTILY